MWLIAYASLNPAQGLNEVVVAGGMESMSNVPHYVAGSRNLRLGNSELVDGLIKDGERLA